MSLYKCDKCNKELSSEDFKTGRAIMDESSLYFRPFCDYCYSEISHTKYYKSKERICYDTAKG